KGEHQPLELAKDDDEVEKVGLARALIPRQYGRRGNYSESLTGLPISRIGNDLVCFFHSARCSSEKIRSHSMGMRLLIGPVNGHASADLQRSLGSFGQHLQPQAVRDVENVVRI